VTLIQSSLEKPKKLIPAEIISSQIKNDAGGLTRLIESWLSH